MIELSVEEMGICAQGGAIRVANNIVNGLAKMPNNCPDDEVWHDAVEGAMGEMAVAKTLGIEWSVGTKGGLDVGQFDVRQTKYPKGQLLLQKWDKNRVNILVTGQFGKYKVIGYLYNPYGMVPKYWRGDIERPCYWIPQQDLIPFTTMENLEKYRHQCAVRQLLVYFKEMGPAPFQKYISEKRIDPWLVEEARDQYRKGNRGEKDVWFE